MPTATSTPIQDVEAYKDLVVSEIEAYLAGEFAVLDVREVAWQGSTLLVDIQTSYGSDTFNIEAGYYLCIGVADLLVNQHGLENIALIAGDDNFSLAYRAVSIHGDLPHGADMDWALLERMADEELTIEEWFTEANVRLID